MAHQSPRRKLVVLSTADYNSPVWTNKQFVATGLAPAFEVHYIESLGLREPSLRIVDIKRMLARLFRRGGEPASGQPGLPPLSIHSPRVLPFHRFRVIRLINRRLMRRLVRRVGVSDEDVLWTFSPLTYGIGDHFGAVVYHSVDLLHTIPGVPAKVLLNAERALAATADVAIASSEVVQRHLRQAGAPAPRLWENVASTGVYAANIAERREPRAIFAGHITPAKVEAALLHEVLELGIQVAVAGPITLDGTELTADLKAVLNHPRAKYLGNLTRETLALEVGRSQVGLIPYRLTEHTAGIFPMKIFEYLAGGLMVVSTPLESVAARGHLGVVTTGPDNFAGAVQHALKDFTEGAARARSAYAQDFSWERRVSDARDLIDSLFPDPNRLRGPL